jgi:phage terminase large subunit-like protein
MDDRQAWAAANPAMGKFRSINDIEKQCRQAMEMPANEPEFRNLILNQRVEASSPFVAPSVWKANGSEADPVEGKRVWGGLDLSSVSDLTALVLVSEQGDVHSEFWLPGEGLAEKSRKDHVPYDLWAKQGFLNTTPGRAIEYEFVAEFMRGLFDRCDVQAIAFDRALFVHLKPWLVKANFSDYELEKFIPYGQGTLSMTPALRELEVKLLGKRLKHSNHPILEMCARNAVVVGDSGARKFDKKKQHGRIDGMVALAMAVAMMPNEGTGPSVYEERGVFSF